MSEATLMLTPAADQSGTEEGRTLPSNVEAEAAFLGAILIDNSVYEELPNPLRPEHFFVPAHRAIMDRVLAMLRERELISSAYLERHLPVTLEDGSAVETVAYVIDPAHEQYCQFPLERQAQMIARAVGGRGPNPEYLFRTAAHLASMQIEDPDMLWLVDRVRALLPAEVSLPATD